MQPSDRSNDLAVVCDAWTRFTETGQLGAGLDPLVAVSWKRCAPRLNPLGAPQWAYLSDDVLPLTLNQHASMRAIARPLMEDVHQYIEGAGAALLFCDSTNCLLEMLGDREAVAAATHLGFRRGAFLDETRIGTTAFSVALIERAPVQIVGPEHFLQCFHALGSAAASIFDLDGGPVGVIGLLGPVDRHSRHVLGIVVGAAKAIENQLQADLFIHEANTQATELNETMDAISEGVLAWTAGGVITHLNHRAGLLLGLTPTMVVGRPLAEYLTLQQGFARALVLGEELHDVEATLAVQGRPVECLVSLRIIRTRQGDPAVYIATLQRIERVRQLVHRQLGAQARLTLDDIVGHGPAARRVRRQALAAANARGCVLLIGESGTNKNPLARAIHNSGARADGPFIAINCGAIPRALVLGEFLGFAAGAFNSGRSTGQPSKFELADGGTLLLEDVEALPLEMQAALLAVIESGEVTRLGGTRTVPVDMRVIASTEVDLEARVAEGAFRPDLLFRLSSFVIMPRPLRERPEDLPLLIDHLLEQLSAQIGRPLSMTAAARRLLRAYPWPGNISELEAAIERAALRCMGRAIQPAHLPDSVRRPHAKVPNKPIAEPVRSLAQAEEVAILSAARFTQGNLSRAAELLGIGRTTLWRKMRELGLSAKDFGTDRPRAAG
ncbi:MAG TPA: sigma 54-interacting transcriptional regulator [bacterium]|nr:sigma 54-interacting transcriptional regulator [bacterium]